VNLAKRERFRYLRRHAEMAKTLIERGDLDRRFGYTISGSTRCLGHNSHFPT